MPITLEPRQRRGTGKKKPRSTEAMPARSPLKEDRVYDLTLESDRWLLEREALVWRMPEDGLEKAPTLYKARVRPEKHGKDGLALDGMEQGYLDAVADRNEEEEFFTATWDTLSTAEQEKLLQDSATVSQCPSYWPMLETRLWLVLLDVNEKDAYRRAPERSTIPHNLGHLGLNTRPYRQLEPSWYTDHIEDRLAWCREVGERELGVEQQENARAELHEVAGKRAQVEENLAIWQKIAEAKLLAGSALSSQFETRFDELAAELELCKEYQQILSEIDGSADQAHIAEYDGKRARRHLPFNSLLDRWLSLSAEEEGEEYDSGTKTRMLARKLHSPPVLWQQLSLPLRHRQPTKKTAPYQNNEVRRSSRLAGANKWAERRVKMAQLRFILARIEEESKGEVAWIY